MGCACSPEHAHEVQSPVGVGTDVVDVCGPERSLESMTPSTFAQLILSSSRPSIFSGGITASGCFREKVTIISLVLAMLSCILLLFDHSALSLATSCRLEFLPVTWQHSQEAVLSTNFTRRLPSSRSSTMNRKTMGPTRVTGARLHSPVASR